MHRPQEGREHFLNLYLRITGNAPLDRGWAYRGTHRA